MILVYEIRLGRSIGSRNLTSSSKSEVWLLPCPASSFGRHKGVCIIQLKDTGLIALFVAPLICECTLGVISSFNVDFGWLGGRLDIYDHDGANESKPS